MPAKSCIREPLPDLSLPTFVQARKGMSSSLLASVAVGSSVYMESSPLQDNEDYKVMGNQLETSRILVEKVTKK